jgi:hypothetical protein
VKGLGFRVQGAKPVLRSLVSALETNILRTFLSEIAFCFNLRRYNLEHDPAAVKRIRVYKIKQREGTVERVQAGAYTRPLFSSTKMFRSHLPVSPCLIDWGGNHAPNVSHKMCLR